jgi:cytochrome c553
LQHRLAGVEVIKCQELLTTLKDIFMKMIIASVFTLTTLTAFAQDAANGEKLYSKCISCHGKEGMGMKAQKAPMIAGQYDWYIEAQVNAIIKKERDNANTKKMMPFVKNLSEKDIKDLAAYISKLTPDLSKRK